MDNSWSIIWPVAVSTPVGERERIKGIVSKICDNGLGT